MGSGFGIEFEKLRIGIWDSVLEILGLGLSMKNSGFGIGIGKFGIRDWDLGLAAKDFGMGLRWDWDPKYRPPIITECTRLKNR